MAEDHHVIPQQRIKQRRSHLAVMRKNGRPLTDAEDRLLDTPLATVLADQRNLVRKMPRDLHHRAHHGARPYRLTEADLHRLIDEFAADFGLEYALEHERRLMRQGAAA